MKRSKKETIIEEENAINYIIQLGDKKIDIRSAFPLRLGDWKMLEKHGVNPLDMGGALSISGLCILTYVLLNKVDKTVTQEDIDNVEIGDDTNKLFSDVTNALSEFMSNKKIGEPDPSS